MAGYRKLGKTASQRKALLRNQVTNLLYNGKIVTTEARAKEIRGIAEGFIALAVKEKKTLMNFDGLLYILGSIPMFVLTLILILMNFIVFAAKGMTLAELGINILRYLVPTFIFPILTAILIMMLDKKPIKPMLKGLLFYPLFLGSWLLINFKCLFKRETSWEKIEHVRDIKINEVY